MQFKIEQCLSVNDMFEAIARILKVSIIQSKNCFAFVSCDGVKQEGSSQSVCVGVYVRACVCVYYLEKDGPLAFSEMKG